jgi:hypothetical protein
MRKANALVFVLMLGVVAFLAAPAFAGYTETDNMGDQANHSTYKQTDEGGIGFAADSNRQYGVGTILIPYTHVTYDFPGCSPVTDNNGNPIPGTYQCNSAEGADTVDAALILQDVFGMLTEGNVGKAWGNFGIAQYLDSLFDWTGDGQGLTYGSLGQGTGMLTQYIDQTLDQDLADLTAGPSGQYGIWQRLHTTFDRVANASGLDEDGMDQTVEAYLAEEGGASWGGGPLTGEVISYMGQWFQKGSDHRCDGTYATGTSCNHDEFGGHGTITHTEYVPNTTQHDP